MGSKITSFEEYQKVYKESIEDPESYWAKQAESFDWHSK
jgi:acetyl-CoA synthetase